MPFIDVINRHMGRSVGAAIKAHRLLLVPFFYLFLKKELLDDIKCIVLMYGIPLKIKDDERNRKEQGRIDFLKERIMSIEQAISPSGEKAGTGTSQEELFSAKRALENALIGSDRSAALDSEIALIRWGPYPLQCWVKNPCYAGKTRRGGSAIRDEVMMVSRLDALSPVIVRRIIDDGIEA